MAVRLEGALTEDGEIHGAPQLVVPFDPSGIAEDAA
jgi:hypothetical protein